MNRIKLSLLTLAAAIPAAGVMLAGAASPNLIANGAFTNNVAGWDNFSGNPQFDKGSMVVTNNYQGNGNSYYSGWYCVGNLEPGTEYQATGDYFVPLSAPANSGADLSVHFYASNDCSGNNLLTGGGGQSGGRVAEQRDQWLTFSFKSEAPATAHSARVRATAFKEPKAPQTSIPEIHKVNFDNMYFGEVTKLIIAPQPTATPKGPGDIIANPQPTATPKGPGDIIANPQPTATPKGPQDVVANPQNPQPTATPQAPDAGDTAPDEPNAPNSGSGSNGNAAGDPGMDEPNSASPGDAKQTAPGVTTNGTLATNANDDGGSVGLGIGLLFVGLGSVIAATGVGLGVIVKRRRNED